MLGRRIAARPRPPATVRDLEIALLEEWNSIPQSLIDNLIASMANRISKKNDAPRCLQQFALEIINCIPEGDMLVYTDGSKDKDSHSGSGPIIKDTNGIVKIKKRNPERFYSSVFKNIWGNEEVDALAKEGAKEVLATSNCLTYLELYSARKHIDKKTWIVPPVHTWYRADSPGGSLAMHCDRCTQTALSRFLSGHLRSLVFQWGHKTHPICPKCIIEQASLNHILRCLGLSYNDLLDISILVYDFLRVNELIDLVV
ncbi:putative RNA-directed DNA polymerase from transposon BS [Trichonephila clavipes]|nr:putative RNA-directed DNA polymerase from transposon BS [Trichonephila clavipes]